MSTASVTAHTAGQRGRAAFAGWIGTTIEFYDFFIFGTAAALVFPKVFFPALGETAGAVASFASVGVAFVARPLGGVIFGYFGDKIGRKATMITTLLIMGVATTMIGLIQPAAAWGVAAPILIFVLRFIQGIAAGGEWASAALFIGEHAPDEKRAQYTMAQPLGTGAGLLLSTITFALISANLSPEAFLDWGWRVPFLLSIVLVVIGLIIRLGVKETPVFLADREARAGQRQKSPIIEVFRHQWKQVLITAGMAVFYLSFLYLSVTYMTSYGTQVVGFTSAEVLTVTIIAVIVDILATIAGALLVDRIGRKPVALGTALLGIGWAFALYPLASSGSLVLMGVAMSGSMLLVGFACIAVTTYLPESFPTRYRSTGVGIAFNLGSIVGGAIPPIIAAPLLASGGTLALSIMLAVAAAITVISTIWAKETRGTSLFSSDAAQPAERVTA